MQFLRQHVFYVILLAGTLALGGGGLVYYLLSDVDAQLRQRRALSSKLGNLADRRERMNEQTVKDQKARIELVRAAAKKAAEDSLNFNRRNLPVLQLKRSEAQFEPALPYNEERYKLGLELIFIKQYTKALEEMISPDRADLAPTRKATPEEVREEEERLREQWKEQAPAQAAKTMRLRKAEAGMVFIDEETLDRRLKDETTARPDQVWEAQVNLWLTREILQAIAATNRELADERQARGIASGKPCVLNSAVKRLVKININETAVGTGGGPGARSASLTGRSATGQYAAIEYGFTVVMPPRQVPRLLRNLMLQNYHTVVRVGTAELSRERDEHYYGTEPVVTVEISAEMLLLLDWARPLIPDEVKSRLPAGRPAA